MRPGGIHPTGLLLMRINGTAPPAAALRHRKPYRPRAWKNLAQLPHHPQGLLLTAREWEVLRHLAEGRSCAETARRMMLAPDTVKTYRASIYRHLQVPNAAAAVNVGWTLEILCRCHPLTPDPVTRPDPNHRTG